MLKRAAWPSVLRSPITLPLACVAVALLRRLPAWDPASLWLDDLWMALALRHRSFDQLVSMQLPSPIGFLALEKWVSAINPDPEWPLQILPALFGLLAIPLFIAVLRRLVSHPLALALGGLLVACHPTLELYSLRVKHYSLDVVVVTALLWLMVRALRSAGDDAPSPRCAIELAVAALVLAPLSFVSLFVSLCCVHALLLDRLLSAHRQGRWTAPALSALAVTAAFDLCALALHQRFLADQAGSTMKWFWRTYFLHFDSAATVGLWLARRLLGWPMYALSWPLILLAPLTFMGVRAIARDPLLRPLAWAFFALIFGLVLAAALDIYPMGADRTGLFTYPLFWAFTTVGAERMLRAPVRVGSRQRQLRLGLLVYAALVCLLRPAVSYAPDRDRQLVEDALRRRQEGDGLLMQHTGLLAFAYYGGQPLRFERYEDVCHRFVALPSFRDLEVVPIAVRELMLRGNPADANAYWDAYYTRGYPRILYLSTHLNESIEGQMVARARAHGYRVEREDQGPETRLYTFERANAPQPGAAAAAFN